MTMAFKSGDAFLELVWSTWEQGPILNDYLWLLLRTAGSGEGIYSYINHGYGEQLTPEEISEMVRISQVPITQFGSATALSNVSFRTTGAAEKSGPLNFFAVFSATVWDFNTKFYSFIYWNLLHLTAK